MKLIRKSLLHFIFQSELSTTAIKTMNKEGAKKEVLEKTSIISSKSQNYLSDNFDVNNDLQYIDNTYNRVHCDINKIKQMYPDNVKKICFYDKDKAYKEFSNFHNVPFNVNGIDYYTSEHYFQSKKFQYEPRNDSVKEKLNELYKKLLESPAPSHAFRLVREYKEYVDPEWSKEIKPNLLKKDLIMKEAIYYKFSFYPELKHLLLNTGDTILIEDSPTDLYWGIGGNHNEPGRNRLGELLMELRDDFRNNK
ncbi:unnamed protein product [Didymodactylos carnosus]|uniref:NADAR domain-containing protein n=1 Tax=Didymodactylos carnosus TaxID=1234261 RepID=A0A815E8J7_9BILA|nr:unnamed protein product [Didymodactylos carnosus]CAF1307988.1 unnamed protein product [Didymodactylos carnosus]CAF3812260.1 unnamed protein product [Didymodactylos carnosus]CAF4142930.1 unnamed protein product [Didymodactylos carnosus]